MFLLARQCSITFNQLFFVIVCRNDLEGCPFIRKEIHDGASKVLSKRNEHFFRWDGSFVDSGYF